MIKYTWIFAHIRPCVTLNEWSFSLSRSTLFCFNSVHTSFWLIFFSYCCPASDTQLSNERELFGDFSTVSDSLNCMLCQECIVSLPFAADLFPFQSRQEWSKLDGIRCRSHRWTSLAWKSRGHETYSSTRRPSYNAYRYSTGIRSRTGGKRCLRSKTYPRRRQPNNRSLGGVWCVLQFHRGCAECRSD